MKVLYYLLVSASILTACHPSKKTVRIVKPNPYMIIADKFFNEQNYTKSLEYYELYYYKKDSSDCYIIFQMAECHRLIANSQRSTEHYKEALVYYNKVAHHKYIDRYIYTFFNKGLVFAELGQYKEAIDSFEKFILAYTNEDCTTMPEEKAREEIKRCKEYLK